MLVNQPDFMLFREYTPKVSDHVCYNTHLGTICQLKKDAHTKKSEREREERLIPTISKSYGYFLSWFRFAATIVFPSP